VFLSGVRATLYFQVGGVTFCILLDFSIAMQKVILVSPGAIGAKARKILAFGSMIDSDIVAIKWAFL